ncbi:F-type H+-transporting ATPase subunit b [Flavobacteriales bacterium]|nr:ATP synthase subunit b [Flavobacteriales bacterium]WKZ74955.1 MAG: F0F1 ATP synthase subunit B [Vicingaceae bacterium]GIK69897.1 MAG: ATP synthase subunit b [Bacteroidota bacterium]MCL4815336.1 F0F1 ATP synthase subunit B [Flavobacteriales bacterium]NUM49876.1 F0F1 ATP synthase subunit B [Flavobacteriales bacterium]
MLSVSIGTIIWTSIAFLTVLFILGKFAWKPILKAIQEREESIELALRAAENAKKEMENLQSSNEKLLNEARIERDKILKEAREAKELVISTAKGKASEEAEKIIAMARESIHNEKMAAVTELKNQVAVLSIEIAEKILKQQLSDEDKQKKIIDNLVKDVNLN